MIGSLVRRVWCRRRHAWTGYQMTPAEVALYRHDSSFSTGSWHRVPCRWCRDHGDEMPRVPTEDARRRLLDREARNKLGINARIGRISHVLAPGYGDCLRCHTAWAFVKEHATQYTPSSGCFPLCEACWAEMTPVDRLPFYAELWDRWIADGCDRDPETWKRIRDAVMAGG